MKKYSVYIAPTILSPTETTINKNGIGRKIANKIFPDGSKHWERVGTIESKNKKLALAWLKKNQAIESGFMFVLIQPKIKI